MILCLNKVKIKVFIQHLPISDTISLFQMEDDQPFLSFTSRIINVIFPRHAESKAYIPLRRKQVALGPGVGLAPQRHYFALGIPTCWYLKMLKFVFPRRKTPAGCVVSLALGLCVGHVHFIFFVLISFAFSSRRKRSFQWNMGFTPILYPF